MITTNTTPQTAQTDDDELDIADWIDQQAKLKNQDRQAAAAAQ